MKVCRNNRSALFAALFALLMLLPIFLLWRMSRAEQAKYTAPVIDVGRERGFGEAVPVERMDMQETITVNAAAISGGSVYMELSAYNKPYMIRWSAGPGDYVEEGDTIGLYLGEAVKSTQTGIIQEINFGEAPYIRLIDLEDLLLECYVSKEQKSTLERKDLTLTDQNGNAVALVELRSLQTEAGFRVRLRWSSEELFYGASFPSFTMYTGRVFPSALVVRNSCVYQKQDGHCYVRLVDKDGFFLREVQVQPGYSDGTYTCVSGLEEGDLCDSGYKIFVEGA